MNLLSTFLVSVSPALLQHLQPLSLACFIISMSTTHSFMDVIPSTFLGAPDPSKVLMALPAHKMLLKGKAYEAIRLTVIGSLGCLIFAVLFSPIMYIFLIKLYHIIENYLFWILLSAIIFMIIKDKKVLLNLSFFVLSGALGMIALNYSPIKDPLFPMLSGLFGTSILINSLMDKINIPVQKYDFDKSNEKFISLIGGFLAGMLTSFMPGLGSSQGAAISQGALRRISEKGFLIIIGGINTTNFVLSIITYFSMQKARNGSIIAVSEIIPEFDFFVVIVFMSTALFAGSVSVFVCLKISKIFGIFIQKINYQFTIIIVLIIISSAILFFSNVSGFLLYITSTSLGIISIKSNVAKNHLMGCLLLPILIYFIPF
ncbi:MAG: tripartite tricarboxylate transporter permease [Nanobdellota archaeon]